MPKAKEVDMARIIRESNIDYALECIMQDAIERFHKEQRVRRIQRNLGKANNG